MSLNFSEQQKKNFLERIQGSSTRELLNNIDRIKKDITSYQNTLSNLLNELRIKQEMFAIFSNGADFVEQLEKILTNKKVVNIDIDDSGYLIIETNEITCKASNGGLYDVGRFKIKFDPKNSSIRFYNLDSDKIRRSYWGNKCHHPHISHTGEACLGNSSEIIATLNSNMEYAGVVDIIINFLEQANLSDPAGKFVANWDLIDKDGNVLRKGLVNSPNEDFKYDKTDWTQDRIIIKHTCVYSGDRYPEEDMIFVEKYNEWIYKDYFDDYYKKCKDCGELFRIRELINHEYCQTCFNKKYFKCGICGEIHEINEKVEFVDESGNILILCKKCYDEIPVCEKCGKKSMNLIEYETENGTHTVCNECFNETGLEYDDYGLLCKKEEIYECPDCGRRLHISNLEKREDGYHCPSYKCGSKIKDL